MADELGAAMLAGTFVPKRVAIVEGEPDFLTVATRRHSELTATIGIVSGSWSSAFAAKVPLGVTVFLRTDQDRAGEEYAKEIAATLHHGRFIRRWRVS